MRRGLVERNTEIRQKLQFFSDPFEISGHRWDFVYFFIHKSLTEG